jgi:hypothetical protein
MPPRSKNHFWKRCRIYFRGFRIAVWLLILLLLGSVVYVNQVGLPEFAKRPLLEKLRTHGIELQFSRLRWRWFRGIVAENVHFGRTDESSGLRLSLAEVQLRLNHAALKRLQFQVDSLMLRRGTLVWSIEQTNRLTRELSLENLQTELRFLPNDQWALDNFKARFAGANIQLSGVITNASTVREWELFSGAAATPLPAAVWQGRLGRLADTLDSVRFSAPPDLRLSIHGDARDLYTFRATMVLVAPGAVTPWGTASGGRFVARLFSLDSNGVYRAEVRLHADSAQHRWATLTNLSLSLDLTTLLGETNIVRSDLTLEAKRAQTPWGDGTNVFLSAQWIHAITNPIPLSGGGKARCDLARTPWASGSQIELAAHFTTLTSPPPTRIPGFWTWWTNLQPYGLNWECRLRDFQATNFEAAEVDCKGNWQAPLLTLTNITARLHQGQLDAHADLNTLTRQLHLSLASDFDPHRLSFWIPAADREWLDRLEFYESPRLQADVSLVLPAEMNRQTDWGTEILPALQLQGECSLDGGGEVDVGTNGAPRKLQVSSAHSHFVYSNDCWHLPDLTLTAGGGRFQAEHRANGITQEFYWRIDSTLAPDLLRPILTAEQQKGLDLFAFTQAPVIHAQIWGNGTNWDDVGCEGSAALTNFVFRGQPMASLQTTFRYTNAFLSFSQPRILVGSRDARADGLGVDLKSRLIFLTNGVSSVEPMIIARAIGPHIVRAIQAYHFLEPPAARVYGTIPMYGEDGADLHFDLDGGPFHWWKLTVPHIVGHVHWAGKDLTLSGVRADFYGGQAAGSAAFDFRARQGADFQFTLAVSNALLHPLMADLSSGTNHLEGLLDGAVAVTRANTENWQSVFGYGDATLRNGLIWDFPIFGIFSPVLNSISPGLGNSRASAANCMFTLTNGVFRSSDLDIRCTGMRLTYRGTVDLQSQVNARAEAELLRDTPLVGPLLSTVLMPVTKVFTYKVTGTLEQPKTELLPLFSRMLFHPFRTLRGLWPEADDPSKKPLFLPLPP